MISSTGFNGYLNVWATQPLMSRVICSELGSQVPVYTNQRGVSSCSSLLFLFLFKLVEPLLKGRNSKLIELQMNTVLIKPGHCL